MAIQILRSKNQIVAFIIGLALSFFFYFIDKFAVLMPPSLGAVMQYISVDFHFGNIARGVVDSRDVIYYLSLIVFFLFLTERSLNNKQA